MVEGDKDNGQMEVSDSCGQMAVCGTVTKVLAAAVQYLERHNRSILNSGSLPWRGFTGSPGLGFTVAGLAAVGDLL